MHTNFSDMGWNSPEFAHEVRNLARGFESNHGLPPPAQLGIMVADVESAATELEGLGMDHFFVAAGTSRHWIEDGVPRSMSGTLGIAYQDGIEIELIEPGTGSDWYRNSLKAGGSYVVQHLGYCVPDVDRTAAQLQAAGFPLRVRGLLANLGMRCHFAYLDTREASGFITELLDLRVAGLRVPPRGVYRPLALLQQILGMRRFSL